MIKPTRISFGGTAAIVTSMALIAGLDAAHAGRATMVSALLIAAVADNLTDSLSVHTYQESERLEQREAFVGTLTNFATRFIVCLSFVLIVVLCTVPRARCRCSGNRLGDVIAHRADLHSRPVSESQRNVRSRKTSRSCLGDYLRQQKHWTLDQCARDLNYRFASSRGEQGFAWAPAGCRSPSHRY